MPFIGLLNNILNYITYIYIYVLIRTILYIATYLQLATIP